MLQYARKASVPAMLAVLTLAVSFFSGCGQKDTPAATTPSPPPVSHAATPAPPGIGGGQAGHQQILQAQSDYWRKHGQGLNSTPPEKPKPK